MASATHLWLIGCSVRAAAASAHRAGFAVHAIDAYADDDLAPCCVEVQHWNDYPNHVAAALKRIQGDWLFTGAMENHLSAELPPPLWNRLLGCSWETIQQVRNPWQWPKILRSKGLRTAEVANSPVGRRAWLCKPVRSGGGQGIRRALGTETPLPGTYFQEELEGLSCSAAYLADGERCKLLACFKHVSFEGAERPFLQAGCVGPMNMPPVAAKTATQWGELLTQACGLRGLFGIDFILTDEGGPVPVEINPRYTASMELAELACGLSLAALHVGVLRKKLELEQIVPSLANDQLWGKYCVRAPDSVLAPKDLIALVNGREFKLTDIPPPGAAFRQGEPLFTVLVQGNSEDDVVQRLASARGQCLDHVNRHWQVATRSN